MDDTAPSSAPAAPAEPAAPATLAELTALLHAFSAERDWHRFQTPRSLLLALVGEVGELAELFQWLTDEQAEAVADDPAQQQRVGEEVADVLAHLLALAERVGVDPARALVAKVAANGEKYPVELSRGSAAKYTELRSAGRAGRAGGTGGGRVQR